MKKNSNYWFEYGGLQDSIWFLMDEDDADPDDADEEDDLSIENYRFGDQSVIRSPGVTTYIDLGHQIRIYLQIIILKSFRKLILFIKKPIHTVMALLRLILIVPPYRKC